MNMGGTMSQTSILSKPNKELIWERRRAGKPKVDVATETGLAAASVFSCLRYDGGIQPREQRRRPGSLGASEREEITSGLAAAVHTSTDFSEEI